MLARLTLDQISEHWDVIKIAVHNSLPPLAGDGVDRDNNILEALLEQRMDCWMEYGVSGSNSFLSMILLTTITEDDCAGVRQLLIYSMYGWRRISEEEWEEGLERLKEWAKECGCSKIAAYTNSPRVLAVTEKLGFSKEYSLITLNCV